MPSVSRFGTANSAASATNAPRSGQDRRGSTACARNSTGTAVNTAPTTRPHHAPAENEPSTALPITWAHQRGRNADRNWYSSHTTAITATTPTSRCTTSRQSGRHRAPVGVGPGVGPVGVGAGPVGAGPVGAGPVGVEPVASGLSFAFCAMGTIVAAPGPLCAANGNVPDVIRVDA
jgi:hypothetical protein